MLKWTQPQKYLSSNKNHQHDPCQIKKASVRILRRERDKENCQPHILRRWIARSRRKEPEKSIVCPKNQSRSIRKLSSSFYPRRIFGGTGAPDFDSGSVYMKLERLPTAVAGLSNSSSKHILNDISNKRCLPRAEPIIENNAKLDFRVRKKSTDSNRVCSPEERNRDVIITEFTDQPAGNGLCRPVALKGNSPEAQNVSSSSGINPFQCRSTRSSVESEHCSKKPSSIDPARQIEDSAPQTTIANPSHSFTSVAKNSNKPFKKACVKPSLSSHVHNDTGQHIHPGLHQHGPQSCYHYNTRVAGNNTDKSEGKSSRLPDIQQAVCMQYRHPYIQGTTKNSPQFCRRFHCVPSDKSIRGSEKDLNRFIGTQNGIQKTILVSSLGVNSPKMYTASTAKFERENSTNEHRYNSGCDQQKHSIHNDAFERSEQTPLTGYCIQKQQQNVSMKCDMKVSSSNDRKHDLCVNGKIGGMKSSELESLSIADFSDFSTSEAISSWSDPFIENSGRTVIENPLAVSNRQEKDIFNREIVVVSSVTNKNCDSSVESDCEIMRNSQLYRSYQNIGSVFAGFVSYKAKKCSPSKQHQNIIPARCRYRPYKKPVIKEDTYLSMQMNSSQDVQMLCKTNYLSESSNPKQDKGRKSDGQPFIENQKISNFEPCSPLTDDTENMYVNWSLEAQISDTLPLTMSDLSLTDSGTPRNLSNSYCDKKFIEHSSYLVEQASSSFAPGRGKHQPQDSIFDCEIMSNEGENYHKKCNTRRKARMVEIPANCFLESTPNNDTLDSWSSHRRSFAQIRPPLAAPRNSQESAETSLHRRYTKRKASYYAASSRPQGLSKNVTPSVGMNRIWRHPRLSGDHSTPAKRVHNLSRCAHSKEYREIAHCGRSSVLGPEDIYLNTMTYGRSANSSIATSVWTGRKSRRVVSTQCKKFDMHRSRGQLRLRIYENSGLLTIHVIRARSVLTRGVHVSNSYVKVSLLPETGAPPSCCRTRTVRHCSHPVYDERFSFEFVSEDRFRRLLVSLWHKHIRRGRRRSEFIGCMSFGVQSLLGSRVDGWFRLLPAQIGRSKHCTVRHGGSSFLESSSRHTEDFSDDDSVCQTDVIFGSPFISHRSRMAVIDSVNPAPSPQQSPDAYARALAAREPCHVTAWSSKQRSRDEPHTSRPVSPSPHNMSLSGLSQLLPDTATNLARQRAPHPTNHSTNDRRTAPASCSTRQHGHTDTHETALDVRRACSDSVLATHEQWRRGARRRGLALASVSEACLLRPPYRRVLITRQTNNSFGLSLAWTCPPRVISVEEGGSGDVCGLKPGDYIVRIGGHNVVLMNQASGLRLIQRQKSVLELVVYRSTEQKSPALMEMLRWT